MKEQQIALNNGTIKYGAQRAEDRAVVAGRMRKARKTFPADLIMALHRLPAFIKAERARMRAYAKTLR